MIALTQQTTMVSNKIIAVLREFGIHAALGLVILNLSPEWVEENQELAVFFMGFTALVLLGFTADQYYQLPSNSNPKPH